MSSDIKKWFTTANEYSERLLKACGNQAEMGVGRRKLHEVVRDFAVAAIFFDHVKEVCMSMTMDLVDMEMTKEQRDYLREFVSEECMKATDEFNANMGRIGHVSAEVAKTATQSQELPPITPTEKPNGDLN